MGSIVNGCQSLVTLDTVTKAVPFVRMTNALPYLNVMASEDFTAALEPPAFFPYPTTDQSVTKCRPQLILLIKLHRAPNYGCEELRMSALESALTKLQLLHIGNLEAEEGWFKRGGGTSTLSNPKPDRERRKLMVMSVLIEHPTEGLILFETGSGKNYPEVWGAPINDVFARVDYDESQELDQQIERTGHSVKDVTMVILGHLHIDHAGGLELFRGTKVPIYVHEAELKHAFYSVATGSDLGEYSEVPRHQETELTELVLRRLYAALLDI
ncbi:MAG: hypothetical protein Q9157_006540 [Trypethelium eluteriae]